MSLSDAAVLIVYLVLLTVFAIAQLWWWLSLLLVIALIELAAKLVSGQTLSQQFRKKWREQPRWRWVLGGALGVALLVLLLHLIGCTKPSFKTPLAEARIRIINGFDQDASPVCQQQGAKVYLIRHGADDNWSSQWLCLFGTFPYAYINQPVELTVQEVVTVLKKNP